MNEASPSLLKYTLFFSALYAAMLIIINVLQFGFGIDVGSGANMGMLIGAGLGAAIKFVQDVSRPPTNKEKRLLSLGCVIASLFISIISLMLTVNFAFNADEVAQLDEILNKLSLVVWSLITIFICALYYFALLFIFGWGAKKFATKTITKKI